MFLFHSRPRRGCPHPSHIRSTGVFGLDQPGRDLDDTQRVAIMLPVEEGTGT